MKNKKINLELVKNLTKQSKEKIEKQNKSLITQTGACICITFANKDTVQAQVNNLNGVRTPKVKLLQRTYKILSENLPKEYRISIKL